MAAGSTGGRSVESTLNDWIAEAIECSGWCTARSERTRTITGRPMKRPDIIVRPTDAGSSNRAVVIETETNHINLENEVEDRLGITLVEGNVRPSCVVGVWFPDKLAYFETKDEFMMGLKTIQLEYFMHDDVGRFPSAGYLRGTLTDVVAAIRMSMVPRSVIDDYARIIQREIDGVASILSKTDDGVKSNITGILGYNRDNSVLYGMNDTQAMNMAALMILNACIFYEDLASRLEGVKSLTNLSILQDGVPTKHEIINGMNVVLDINYAPVFEITRKLLNVIPGPQAADIINSIMGAVSQVMNLGMQNSGDVYGTLYQNDLIERKKSASFYTRPEAATLLASLVLPPSGNELYKDISKIRDLRIGDFACGTGMLLTAAYNHIIHCHANDSNISDAHPHIMTHVLWGFDIMPTATHLTVSNLAGLYPSRTFVDAHIYQMPIGTRMPVEGKRRSHKPVYSLGSLDLIRNADTIMDEDSISMEILSLTDASLGTGSGIGVRHGGLSSHPLASVRLKSASFDYVLMNPPFVRATNHGGGRDHPVPPFAVFGIPPNMQTDMSRINKGIYNAMAADGDAGLSTNFITITHEKLKSDGSMGFILPATLIAGISWIKIRNLLNDWYDDTIIIMLRRSTGIGEATFSSNTGMEEAMLITTKRNDKRPDDMSPRIKFVLLDKMPMSRLEASEIAKIIRHTSPNMLEHGMGGTSLQLGTVKVGDMLDCPVEDGRWMLAKTSNIFLLQFVYNLITGNAGVEMICIGKMAQVGKISRDITGKHPNGSPRGPFNRIPYDKNALYQTLWGNNKKNQTAMIVDPDFSLEKRPDVTPELVQTTWSVKSRTYFNIQPRYNTQKIIAAYTEKKALGGRAWPNIILNKKYEKAFTVWLNSTFGILTYWFVAGPQQIGRGLLSPTASKDVPVPDFDKLDGETIAQLDAIFDDLGKSNLDTINKLDTDTVRQEIDTRLIEILNMDVENIRQIYEWLVREPQFSRKNLVDPAQGANTDVDQSED